MTSASNDGTSMMSESQDAAPRHRFDCREARRVWNCLYEISDDTSHHQITAYEWVEKRVKQSIACGIETYVNTLWSDEQLPPYLSVEQIKSAAETMGYDISVGRTNPIYYYQELFISGWAEVRNDDGK